MLSKGGSASASLLSWMFAMKMNHDLRLNYHFSHLCWRFFAMRANVKISLFLVGFYFTFDSYNNTRSCARRLSPHVASVCDSNRHYGSTRLVYTHRTMHTVQIVNVGIVFICTNENKPKQIILHSNSMSLLPMPNATATTYRKYRVCGCVSFTLCVIKHFSSKKKLLLLMPTQK